MKAYSFFTAKEFTPKGWLRDQLRVQANGLSGNLDKVWRDVKESGWFSGDAESWERAPYWLDGFIPLAYLLRDEQLIARAENYMNIILKNQQPSGWLCPCKEEDIPTYNGWPILLISKVLTVYYECSADERVPAALYKHLKNYHTLLKEDKIKFGGWSEYRWFEGLIAINFLYERCKEPWLVDLSRMLKEKGIDYNTKTDLWIRPLNKWTFDTHIVNIVMMLKHEAVTCDILNLPYTDNAEYLHDILTYYNGTAVGLYTGDECLSGLSPIQGTELCAVTEQMYSFEWLYAYTGDKKWAERLEVLAFNALPASLSDDMWTHQYVQMANQIDCIRFPLPGKPIFRTNENDSHIFGLEPNYGCCTANFNQGWPKFALSAFLHEGNTVLCGVALPSVLDWEGGHIELETNYPFEHTFTYQIDAKEDFTFRIRIPSFAQNLTVNGMPVEKTDLLSYAIKKGTQTTLYITFEATPHLTERPNDLFCATWGSLVFSVPITYEKVMYEYTKNDVERKFPYCDYEYVGKSPWNFGYAQNAFEVLSKPIDAIPFSSSHPPVTLRAKVQKINWGYEDGYDTVCAKVPQSRIPISEEETMELFPYGCAKLRMTELPLLD